MSKTKPLVGLCGSLILTGAIVWALLAAADVPLSRLLPWVWLSALAAVPLYFCRHVDFARSAWMLIWAAALLMRVAAWSTPPLLSDDVYRYLWDGKTQLSGINPYRFAPADERHKLPRDADYEAINHKHIPTIYPPLAQATFLLCAWIAARVATLKAAFALLDLALGLFLWRWTRARPGAALSAVLLYLWHPLVIYEFAGSGHVDILWALCFLLSLWSIERQRLNWAAVAFAGAIAAKLIALAFLPLFFRHAGARRTALALGLVAVLYLPYAGAGWNLWMGLQAYSLLWRFNDFGFALLAFLPGGGLTARVLAPLLGLAAAVWVARSVRDVWLGALATTVLLIGLLPVNYPWYWVILPALLVLRPIAPLYLFSLALLATYEVLPRYYEVGIWQLAPWVRGLESVLLAWALWALVRRIRANRFTGIEPANGI